MLFSPVMTNESTSAAVSAFLTVVRGRQASATDYLTKWSAKLIADPRNALEWGENTLAMGAKASVYARVVYLLESGKCSLEVIKSEALSNALHGAKYPGRSTSGVANIFESYVTSVWAELYQELS